MQQFWHNTIMENKRFHYYKQLRSYEILIVTMATTSTATSWRTWWSWRCCCIHIWRTWYVASIICSGASLVCVARVVALWAELHCRAIFSFIHVVRNLLLLPLPKTLAHFWIWIRDEHCIFLGIFSERTNHEVALKSVVPSVHKGFFFVVPRHVPIVVEISNFITSSDHMCAQLV